MSKKRKQTGKLRYKLTNDYLFHIVFQRNKKILRGLVQSLLNLKDEEIIDIVLENPITPGETVNDKTIVLDLFITLNNNKKINIEMQILNEGDWTERSLIYLCRAFDNLLEGQAYTDVMPAIHIGILDYTLFPEHPEFYAHYAIKNIINNNIYSDKFLLNVLDLKHSELATEEDIACGLQYWARLFKAETWEELHMLSSEYEVFEDITVTVEQALADKKIRMECEAENAMSVTAFPFLLLDVKQALLMLYFALSKHCKTIIHQKKMLLFKLSNTLIYPMIKLLPLSTNTGNNYLYHNTLPQGRVFVFHYILVLHFGKTKFQNIHNPLTTYYIERHP